jgi:hypothetical protein
VLVRSENGGRCSASNSCYSVGKRTYTLPPGPHLAMGVPHSNFFQKLAKLAKLAPGANMRRRLLGDELWHPLGGIAKKRCSTLFI